MKTRLTSVIFISLLVLFSVANSQKLLPDYFYVSYSDTHTGAQEYDINVSSSDGSLDSLNLVLNGTHPTIPQPTSYDIILFKSGERFYGQVIVDNSVSDYLTFGAYDTGDMPIIDGSIEHFWFNKYDSDTYDSTYTSEGQTFYTKSISGIDSIMNLYAGDTEQILAREPNEDEGDGGFSYVDSVANTTTFIDNSNSTDWTDGDAVLRTVNWMCEVREIHSSSGASFQLNTATAYPLQANWGYFVQNHIAALDQENEWYFDESSDILYFCPASDSCEIYLVTNQSGYGNGFVIDDKTGIVIEDLQLTNQCVNINFTDGSVNESITIRDNVLCNSNTGIKFKNISNSSQNILNNSSITVNVLQNMRSFGIYGRGEENYVAYNTFDSIGLNFGCENKGQHNLDAVELMGDDNEVSYNEISNIGFCGIRHWGSNYKINYNTITDTMLRLADGGAIYCWHNILGNKQIIGNIIDGSLGSDHGAASKGSHANGIYLDELSCHFRVEDNEITDCTYGIYVQNSRSDSLSNNTLYGNHYGQFYMNHGGSILNGGRANPDNDLEYDPTTDGYSGYEWKSEEKTLRDNSDPYSYVYVEPGNNYIHDNQFTPNDSTYTVKMRLWRKIDEDTLTDMTSNSDFLEDNLTDGYTIEDASILMSYSDVSDNSVVRYVGRSIFSGSSIFECLRGARKVRIERMTGTKTY